jgi:multidrug resistance efflux pump
MEVRTGGSPVGAPPTIIVPQGNGRPEMVVAPTPRRRSARGILIPILLVVGALIAFFGYRYYYNTTHFVWTDNAAISGSIIQVGSLNAGQVSAVSTDVGQSVQKDQVVAKVTVGQTMATTASGSAMVGFVNTQNQLTEVTSPLSGVVVARLADPGSTVGAGQTIVAVVDPTKLYVIANVNETDLGRIKVGESVDVTVDSLNATLPGRVEAITPASAGSFSLIPQSNSSGNYSKVVQVIPVRISVDYGSLPLVIGSSVEVSIHVQ